MHTGLDCFNKMISMVLSSKLKRNKRKMIIEILLMGLIRNGYFTNFSNHGVEAVWQPKEGKAAEAAAWWHCCCCLDWLQGRQMHFGHARSEHLNFPTFIFWHPITQIIGHMLILVKAYQVIQRRPFKASAFAVKLLLLSNEVHTLYSHLCNFWPSHGFILKMRLVKQL